MNTRVVGLNDGRQPVNHALSGAASLVTLVVLVVAGMTLQPAIILTMASIEEIFTAEPDALYLESLLAVVAPALSISAMASPLLVCYRAVKMGLVNHGLQWHLFAAFACASALGVVYGLRVNLYAVVSSNMCGLAIQVISMAAVWTLSERARRYTAYLLERLKLPLGWTQTGAVKDLFHWLVYSALTATSLSVLVSISFFMPLHTMLGPLFTVTCVMPYVATFSTFSRDIVSYRQWERLPFNVPEKAEGPKGVDITTLITMQLNNVLWNWYGILIKDPVILISSTCSFVAAAIQMVVFLLPVFDWRYRNRTIRVDTAYPFLGARAFLTKDPHEQDFRNDEAVEKLSTVELVAETTVDSGPNTEPGVVANASDNDDLCVITMVAKSQSEGSSYNHPRISSPLTPSLQASAVREP